MELHGQVAVNQYILQLNKKLRLASSSKFRKKVLQEVGIEVLAEGVDLDEEEIQRNWKGSVSKLALELALKKACLASDMYSDDIVLACDQTLELEGQLLGKPGSRIKNIEQLLNLQGKEHFLHSAWCLLVNSREIASGVDTVSMKMRSLSREQIEIYVALENPMDSCGGYYYESQGRLLFEEVVGSQDSILGMPVVPVINALLGSGLAQFRSNQQCKSD